MIYRFSFGLTVHGYNNSITPGIYEGVIGREAP